MNIINCNALMTLHFVCLYMQTHVQTPFYVCISHKYFNKLTLKTLKNLRVCLLCRFKFSCTARFGLCRLYLFQCVIMSRSLETWVTAFIVYTSLSFIFYTSNNVKLLITFMSCLLYNHVYCFTHVII